MMTIQVVPAIKRLSLTRVGCWSNLVIDFTPGLNIITGDCGCGKSTILRAMLQAVHPLTSEEYCLTPTVPDTSGRIGIHFYAKSLFIDIPALTGIPEEAAVNESHGHFMLEQLRLHVQGDARGMAVLIEDDVTSGLDNTLYLQAAELLNNATSQIVSIISYRFSLKDFPDARVYKIQMDTGDIPHIKLIQ